MLCVADQTYLLFGRRGSGKTTIRMQVQQRLHTCHAKLRSSSVMTYSRADLPSASLLHVQMQDSYYEYNEHAAAAGHSRGHFMVDLCRPGHMTACLRTFQASVLSVHMLSQQPSLQHVMSWTKCWPIAPYKSGNLAPGAGDDTLHRRQLGRPLWRVQPLRLGLREVYLMDSVFKVRQMHGSGADDASTSPDIYHFSQPRTGGPRTWWTASCALRRRSWWRS